MIRRPCPAKRAVLRNFPRFGGCAFSNPSGLVLPYQRDRTLLWRTDCSTLSVRNWEMNFPRSFFKKREVFHGPLSNPGPINLSLPLK